LTLSTSIKPLKISSPTTPSTTTKLKNIVYVGENENNRDGEISVSNEIQSSTPVHTKTSKHKKKGKDIPVVFM